LIVTYQFSKSNRFGFKSFFKNKFWRTVVWCVDFDRVVIIREKIKLIKKNTPTELLAEMVWLAAAD